MGSLVVTPIAWKDDDKLPEGRVVIPFTVDFTTQTAAEVDLSNYISVRQLSCIKSMYFSWAGLNTSDTVKIVVYGTNQTLVIGSDGTGTEFNGFLPIFTNMPAKFFFSKTNNAVGGVLTCQAMNFEVDPLTWVPLVYNGDAVTTFNGRNGAVVSQAGDYTAAQVTNALDKTSAALQTITAPVNMTGGLSLSQLTISGGGTNLLGNANTQSINDTNGIATAGNITASHFVSSQTGAPTVAIGAGAGGSPAAVSLTTGATDARGYVNLTTGPTPVAGSDLFTVTFKTPYGTVPVIVLQDAGGGTTANIEGYVTVPTVNGFTVRSRAALTASNAGYILAYMVMG